MIRSFLNWKKMPPFFELGCFDSPVIWSILLAGWQFYVFGISAQRYLYGPWGTPSRPMRQVFPLSFREREVNFFQNGLHTLVGSAAPALRRLLTSLQTIQWRRAADLEPNDDAQDMDSDLELDESHSLKLDYKTDCQYPSFPGSARTFQWLSSEPSFAPLPGWVGPRWLEPRLFRFLPVSLQRQHPE